MKQSASNRSSSARKVDYMCEWDVPKECDIKKEVASIQAFDIHKPTENQLKMMPNFGFFTLIK